MAIVTLDDMRDTLLTLDAAKERLAASEPLNELTFPVSADITFTAEPGWADGPDDDAAPVFLTTGAGAQYQLTHKAALEAGAQCGIPRGYQERLPASLLVPQLNYWFRGGFGEKEFKLLSHDRGEESPLALAMCRGTITPFSNLALVDLIEGKIKERYGDDTEILVDYKFHHDLEYTGMRLITPAHTRVMTGTRVEEDTWCSGISVRNSLIGLKPTDLAGYVFRYWCTNGSTDTLTSSGQFSRRGKHDEGDVWNWARDSVDKIFQELDGSFDSIQALASVPVGGDMTVVLDDLFNQYGIPVGQRQRIRDWLLNLEGPHTLFDIHDAITRAANLNELSPRTVEQLLGMGGHIAHAATARCSQDHPCRRLLPEGYTPPAPTQAQEIAAIAATN